MKAVTILVGALAAVVAAAPAAAPAPLKELDSRNVIDLSGLNGLNRFRNDNFNYLTGLNGGLDLALLLQLGQAQNFNVLQFQNLFVNDVFGVAELLQFEQLRSLLQLSQLGVFNGLDLRTLQFNSLQFGLLSNVGNFGFGSLIDSGLNPQIAAIAAQTFVGRGGFIKE